MMVLQYDLINYKCVYRPRIPPQIYVGHRIYAPSVTLTLNLLALNTQVCMFTYQQVIIQIWLL